jgi:hypothetical protein
MKLKLRSEPKSNMLGLLARGIRNAKAMKIHWRRDRNEPRQGE